MTNTTAQLAAVRTKICAGTLAREAPPAIHRATNKIVKATREKLGLAQRMEWELVGTLCRLHLAAPHELRHELVQQGNNSRFIVVIDHVLQLCQCLL